MIQIEPTCEASILRTHDSIAGMTWQDWASDLLGPSLYAILIATVIAFALPIGLHFYLHYYKPGRVTNLPSFLLIGPSGSGKTSVLTHVTGLSPAVSCSTDPSQLERGKPAATHTSHAPLAVEATLSVSTVTASSRFRSTNDPTLQARQKVLLIDTPGHGKLRYYAWDSIAKPQNLKGIIFVVDAANLASSGAGSLDDGLRDTAEYLHDVLLVLQNRLTKATSSKAPQEMPVLVAANKADLFTALPAPLVKTTLEAEITKVRSSRSRGLLDSGIGMGEDSAGLGEDRDWLGEGGEGSFDFGQMQEANVPVEVAGGCVVGSDGAQVDAWWDWIASCL